MPDTSLSILEIERVFADDPKNGREQLCQLKASNHREFLSQAIQYLEVGNANSYSQVILQICREDAFNLNQMLFTADLLTLDEAARLLRVSSKNDPGYQEHLISSVMAEIEKAGFGIANQELTRLLEILAKSVDSERLSGMLAALCGHPDERLRSKVALLVGSLARKLPKRAELLKDIDPRVRANAVEALWGKRDSESMQLLKDSSLDAHHRVAANGLYGMYLGGELAAIRGILKLSREEDQERQLAGFWTLGKTGDPRFQTIIDENLPVRTGRAKFALLNAGRKIKTRVNQLRQLPPVLPEVLHFERLPTGRVCCTFLLRRETGERLHKHELLGTDVIVHDGDLSVDQFHFEARGSEAPVNVAFLVPGYAGIENPFASHLAGAVEAARTQKRAEDHWTIKEYGLSAVQGGVTNSGTNSAEGPTEALRACVDRAVRSFPADAAFKQVVLLLDPSLEAEGLVPEHWPKLFDQCGAVLHVVCCRTLEAESLRSWRKLCIGSRGLFVQVENLLTLPATLGRIAVGLSSNFYLSYQLSRSLPNTDPLERLTLEFIPSAGYAKITVLRDGSIELNEMDTIAPDTVRAAGAQR